MVDRKTWHIEDPAIFIDGVHIPFWNAGRKFKYLGVNFTPWRGLDNGDTPERLLAAFGCISKLPLKPHQKVDLFYRYVYPRLRYVLVSDPPSESVLTRLDADLRYLVKKVLHLTPSVTDSLFYTSSLNGGLGLPRITADVITAYVKSFADLGESSDPVLLSLYEDSYAVNKVKVGARSLGLDWPVAARQVLKKRVSLKRAELAHWKNLHSQGHGVEYFVDDTIANAWLHDPSFLKPGRYIDAIRMRTNTFGCRAVLKRAKADGPVECRRCGDGPETLGHVLGKCSFSKARVIRRHDQIVDFIIQRIQAKNPQVTVLKEASFKANTGLLKPDLVVKDRDRALVADVTVRYESTGSLERAAEEKSSKYSPLLCIVNETLGTSGGAVLPIVVGARGALPKSTLSALSSLGVSDKSDWLTISLMALRSSIELACAFLDD